MSGQTGMVLTQRAYKLVLRGLYSVSSIPIDENQTFLVFVTTSFFPVENNNLSCPKKAELGQNEQFPPYPTTVRGEIFVL